MDVNNPKLEFPTKPSRVTYDTTYYDSRDNQWQVVVSGLTDLVEDFVGKKPLILEIVPLTEEQYSQLLKEAASRPPLPSADEARPMLVFAPDQADQGEGMQHTDPQLPPDLTAVGRPAFILTLILVEPKTRGPYQVIFELDPPITQATSPYVVNFVLRGSDFTPNVSCQATRGSVWYSLSGSSQNWAVTVHWSSGAPAYFVLRGDVVRN